MQALAQSEGVYFIRAKTKFSEAHLSEGEEKEEEATAYVSTFISAVSARYHI